MAETNGRGAPAVAGTRPTGNLGDPVLTDADFSCFQTMFHQRTGILFGRSKLYFIQKRIGARMDALGIHSVQKYLAHAASGRETDEFQKLVNAMTVNETYFNREELHFRTLVEAILPEIERRNAPGDSIRIWSIPCSSGDEAYSIAIWLLERWPAVDRYTVEIVGSDVDTIALAKAREGIYSARAVQPLSTAILAKYFRPTPSGDWSICSGLKRSVDFTHVNICDPGTARGGPRFDVVFCRNLLIYFDDQSRRRALTAIHEALVPGGYCCLGPSDYVDRANGNFQQIRLHGSIVYRVVK